MVPIKKNDLMYNQSMSLKQDVLDQLGMYLYDEDTFEPVAYSMKNEPSSTVYMVQYDLGNEFNITALVNVPLHKPPQI